MQELLHALVEEAVAEEVDVRASLLLIWTYPKRTSLSMAAAKLSEKGP